MCGIVGAIAQRNVGEILLEGLKRLEYRGYDSAGIVVVNQDQQLNRLRAKGKVQKLCDLFQQTPLLGKMGIAHTRWATHGVPSERNAHPHQSGEDIALAHNGIIENYEELRDQLMKYGYQFESDTDTETIAHLIHQQFMQTKDFLKAVQLVVKKLKGAYALAIVNKHDPERIIAVRSGSPLVVGLGIGENFIASDNLALLPVTQKFIFLEEGDIAEIQLDKVLVYDANDQPVQRKIFKSELVHNAVSKDQYRHFMQKEIFEQPRVLEETMEGRYSTSKVFPEAFGEQAKTIFDQVENVQIVACGTSYNAGCVARYWIEEIAKLPCQVEVASEFRYRKKVVPKKALFITISQSGETADTLAALRQAKEMGYLASLAICNVPESSIIRESDLVFLTRAGTEIGVASTKAFTTQLLSLFMLTTVLAGSELSEEEHKRWIALLREVPRQVEAALQQDAAIKKLAENFADKEHALFLGRGLQYPIAVEGALKLKEISYIHAEAYPAGELKHGPLALVDKEMPVITVAPNDELLEKLKSNLQEVKARGGQLIIFADKASGIKNGLDTITIEMPKVDSLIAPIVYTIPLQLLAYHVALIKGTDVDQPRNLAKSVTVE